MTILGISKKDRTMLIIVFNYDSLPYMNALLDSSDQRAKTSQLL